MRRFLAFFLIVLSTAGSVSAYTRITSSDGRSPRWPSTPVSYWINARGLSQIANGSEFNAIHAAFQTWQNVPTADLQFAYKGTTAVRAVGRDGVNLISFADDTTALGSSTLAATFSFFCTSCANFPTQEADIIFNLAFAWTTSGDPGKFDVQSVLTHEIGHFVGLDHSGLVSSVMVPFAAPNQMDQRTLQYDDIAGVSEIYPKPGATSEVGQIRGSVLSGAVPVFGAHVVAVNRDGNPVVSAVSQPGGSYVLRFLPPGEYRIYAEPLDLPVTEQNIGGGSTSWYRNLKTDFGTTYFGNTAALADAATIQVRASSVATGPADIQVLPKSASSLNLTRPGFGPRIARGTFGTLTLGGMDLSSGAVFSTSNAGVSLGAPTFGTSSSSTSPTAAMFSIAIGSSTPLGPKNITVSRGTDSALVSGTIVIVDPSPSGISVQPSVGGIGGQTRVQIRGSSFRPGAQVYFGGLAATDTHFIDSRALDALTPSNIPGIVNVQVINSDGTNGGATGGFTYLPARPTIRSVSPLSGPPATTVFIEGAEFDSRPGNIEVRFNGASARIAASTATSIQAIVPYGATSGPITVSVFGETAIGPEFKVVPPLFSANLATTSYRFIDALPASGGSTVHFDSDDDALAIVTLPFDFSLFRDVYLAGSSISLATNGFISLESGASAEFQNGPLPGQTVTRTGGITGTTPAALIAPFFDDLVMIPGVSTVNTRVIGSAPNRQFVIEWSRMSILDDTGRDLNASLTFETVLFEGSNDIQFVYESMNGSGANGSGATIGIQDLRRTSGIQTGYNQAVIHSGDYVTYRFSEGQYTSSISVVDASAPTRPVVVDSGTLTNSLSELTASWTSQDAESGIAAFRYAIGTSPGSADIREFTTTVQSSATVGGLNLQSGRTYYFAVIATNNAGQESEVGLSDGIRIDPAFQPQRQYIPYAPQDSTQFSGIALRAPTAMSVVLRAIGENGNLIAGPGVRNPVTIELLAGQQHTRLVSELFAINSFSGWIEAEASATGLSIFTSTGLSNMAELDASVPRNLSTDFVGMNPGATVVLVNPSQRVATVTRTEYDSGATQSLTVPARGLLRVPISATSLFHSTEPVAAVEHSEFGGKVAIAAVQFPSDGQDVLVFPFAVVGAGYESRLTLVNPNNYPVDAVLSFTSILRPIRLEPNSSRQFSVAELITLPVSATQTVGDALRVTVSPGVSGPARLMASLDISNGSGRVFLSPRVAMAEVAFPYVAQGNGLFTGLAIAAGNIATNITIEVYTAAGGPPKSTTLQLGPNLQFARLLDQLIPSVATQTGGYIRIRSDQPIWALEIFGSNLAMAAVPPL